MPTITTPVQYVLNRGFLCDGCNQPITRWRQCGGGCKQEIGYCVDCGGDERSEVEMKLHLAREHLKR
jgi:hypothetical protein